MKNKHLVLWSFVVAAACHYAVKHSLARPDVRRFKKKWRGKFVGSCSKRGVIRIELRGQEPYELIDTLAHELAHLRYKNHSPEWFSLHLRILTDMETHGVYERLREILKNK